MADIRAALLGKLPTGDGNGLAAVASELIKDKARIRVGVILFDADRTVEKTDDGNYEVRARIRRVEVIHDAQDSAVLQRLLMREFERRTGQTTLPFELEQDIEAAFDDLDPAAAADARAAREQAEGHVEHTGADETWAQTLAAFKDGDRPVVCGQCGTEIRWDAAVDGWLDREGWPAADGHPHGPAEPVDGDAS